MFRLFFVESSLGVHTLKNMDFRMKNELNSIFMAKIAKTFKCHKVFCIFFCNFAAFFTKTR